MIEVRGQQFSAEFVTRQLAPFLTVDRLTKIERVARERFMGVVPILENIYDRGNISAVMRTGEALGVGRFVIVESKEQRFKAANRVTQGADKWLDVEKYYSARTAVERLRGEGYQIWATALSARAVPINEVPFDQKVAFFLGNEKAGVSEEALSLCDGNFLIPMNGFSQSFNISVAGALILQHATRFRSHGPSKEQQELLRAKYMIKSLGSAEQILLERALSGSAC